MSIITETKHVITDEGFEKLSDIILKSLEYDLCRQAVNGDVFLGTKTPIRAMIPDDALSAGKSFDEFLKAIDNESIGIQNQFQYVMKSVFSLADSEIPRRDIISPDCVFMFTLYPVSDARSHYVSLDDAFLVFENGIYKLHNAVFSFTAGLNDLMGLKSDIKHECRHVYDEVFKHIAKQREAENPDSSSNIGSLKGMLDRERDEIYQKMIKIMISASSFPGKTYAMRKKSKSMEIFAKSMYLLYDPEIHANYSEFYQELKDNPSKPYTSYTAYRKYYDLWIEITKPIDILSDPDENGNIKYIRETDIIKDNDVFQKVRIMAQKLLRSQKSFKSADDYQDFVVSKINKVLSEMKKIYNRFMNVQKTSEERFFEAYSVYFENLLESLRESYGESDGLYKFTMLKNYQDAPFSKSIDKLNLAFRQVFEIPQIILTDK